MFSLFKTKYTDDEKQYLKPIETAILANGVIRDEATSLAREILDAAIERAQKTGLRGVKNLGDKAIRDERFTQKRLSAGLTKDDILRHLNRDYVMVVAEIMLIDAHRFSIFQTLTAEGESSANAVRFLRKTFFYCDDPEKSHQAYQGDDADIYPEFTLRHEKWRSQISPAEVQELASRYSTYNAMVRDLIRKGII
ncbi:MAG: hypothetical protein M0P95_12905 [Sulfuritalea sp.]|jgi:hypothetical protein|nr:hypothetical protein [Sulfuritalea sp.]